MPTPQPSLRTPGATRGVRAQRTTDLIVRTAKQIFLERGFGGTRIEHITEACGISRSGFYTYFPTKRDVLLAIGTTTYAAVDDCIAELERIEAPTTGALEGWVHRYFDLLDEHGAFILVWNQASAEDDDLRLAGRRSIVHHGRRVGAALSRLGDGSTDGELSAGLALLALLDRYWSIVELMGAPVSRREAAATIAVAMRALVEDR